MEEKTRSLSVNSLYFGLITGAALIVFSLILYITGQFGNRTLGWLGLLILVAGMVWGTTEYRKKNTNGFLSYGKAFSSCFMTGLYAAVLSAVFFYFFVEFVYTDFGADIVEKARQGALESNPNMSDEEMEQVMKWTERFTSPIMMFFWQLVTNVAFSAILALLLAIFLKKEDKSMNAAV